jgi:hypothetical protein
MIQAIFRICLVDNLIGPHLLNADVGPALHRAAPRAAVRAICGLALLVIFGPYLLAQGNRTNRVGPDLQGTWIGATLTPLQRPPDFRDRATFTPAEAEDYVRRLAQRTRDRLPTPEDRLTQVDVGATFVEAESFRLDGLRTSLIIDPENGMLPPLLPAAQARLAARPKRTFEDPETFGLAERCLVGMFGLGGSTASPPMVPSEVVPAYYQIVQTDTHVLIYTEWIHDARIIRLNATHRPPALRQWLGDSIGHYEGATLVVDTTNFRPDTHVLNSGERLHVVERFTRLDPETLRYRVTVDDPETWATSWTAEWRFTATAARMFGVECHEGNYAIENFLRGARASERQKPQN